MLPAPMPDDEPNVGAVGKYIDGKLSEDDSDDDNDEDDYIDATRKGVFDFLKDFIDE